LTLNDSAQVLARKFLRGRWFADERCWPVKLTEILTAVVAVYAAILSTVNLVATIRAKRWRVAVVYSFGRTIFYGGGEPFLLWYRAINLGEREVALKKFYVEVLSEKNNFFWHHCQGYNALRLQKVPRFGLVPPKPLEPPLRQGRISRGVLDIGVPEGTPAARGYHVRHSPARSRRHVSTYARGP
jgi:hypothetical protein